MYIQCSTVKRKGKDGRNRKLVESYRDPRTNQPRNRTVQTLEKLPILERSRIIYKYGGSKYLDAQEWQALADAGDLAGIKTEFKIGDSIRERATGFCSNISERPDWNLFSENIWVVKPAM